MKVKLNGKLDARALKIDPSLIKPEEAEMLEDLIVAAFQDAKTKAEAAVQAKMQEITGGLALPPGLKLFLSFSLSPLLTGRGESRNVGCRSVDDEQENPQASRSSG